MMVESQSVGGVPMKRLISLIVVSFSLLACGENSAEETADRAADRAIDNGETIVVELPGLAEDAKPLEMVAIRAGTFTMGCPPDERGHSGGEWPPHEVTLTKGFYLGECEVTQAQWEAVMESNPAYYSGKPNHPVEQVSWDDCQAFIEKLNALGQGTFRLPTEAEWEYACRAGTDTRFFFGDALECRDTGEYYCETMAEYMWWKGNRRHGGEENGSKEVGRKLPNPWGLHDMHGNLREWCSDWWVVPSDRGPQVDPQRPASGTERVTRGGYWYSATRVCRSAYRNVGSPDTPNYRIGLRLVREYP